MPDIVCVIAGGEWQAPIISKIRENGYEVLCINLYSNTKGAKLADYFEQADVTDKEACLLAAKKYDLKGILTDQSDISVPTVAYIAEKMGLNGIGIECAALFTNKLLMRHKAKSLGVHCPKFEIAHNSASVKNIVQKMRFPVVIKPIDSQSSRGVIVVKNIGDIDFAIAEAFSFTKVGNPILIEEYIDGQEWTVEGFKQKDKHVSLAISFKQHLPLLPTVASSINYVPINDSQLHRQLIEQNDYLVNNMGLEFGITHAEYKYSNGNFYLIEVAARGGGANISSHIIPIMSGVDANQMLLDQVMEKEEVRFSRIPTGNFALLAFLNFDLGKVVSRTEESMVRGLPFVADFLYHFKIGDVIKKVVDDSSRHAQVLIFAKSQHELDENLHIIKELVALTYE